MVEDAICRAERRLFLSEWRRHPAQLGTLAPISKRLADAAAGLIQNPQEARVVEIGAGTGRLTRSILRAGVKPKNLVAVELNGKLCEFLRDSLNNTIEVIEGDACKLKSIIPESFVGTTTTVVSAIPFRYISDAVRTNIIQAAGSVMKQGAEMLHVTYHPLSPMPDLADWVSERKVALWWNLPPAFVFSFKPRQAS